jgi:hypothetical protein
MLNQILLRCKIDEIKPKLGNELKGFLNNKEEVLYIRLLCDETDIFDGIALMQQYKNILMIEYTGTDFNPIYFTLTSDVIGDNYVIQIMPIDNAPTENYIKCVAEETPTGLIPVVKLPVDFCDLELLYKLNQKYPRVRFCGGNLFNIAGCNIGCCGIDLLESKAIKYDLDAYYRAGNCDCALQVCDFKEVSNIQAIVNDTQKDEIEQNTETKENASFSFSDILAGNF